MSDPPAHIDPDSNLDLEQSLAQLKISLQTQKAEVDALVADLEVKSRSLAQRSGAVHAQITQLREIPQAVVQLRADIVTSAYFGWMRGSKGGGLRLSV